MNNQPGIQDFSGQLLSSLIATTALSLPQSTSTEADASLMSFEQAKKLHLAHEPIVHLLSAMAFDGCLMCHVTHQTSPVTLGFKDGHTYSSN